MSEQSGPITREQVERALAKPRNIDYRKLPRGWRELAPDYVIAAEAAEVWDAEHAALTRWRDELAAAEREQRDWLDHVQRLDEAACALRAAEPVRRVARCPEPVRDWKSDRAIAAIWPIQPAEDSPERLRERREALVLSRRSMADLVPHTSICMDNVPEYATHWHPEDIRRCEEVPDAPAVYAQHRTRYAAALSAEEARRAAVGAWAAGGGVLHYSPPTEPERPAPRFKVGDWVVDYRGTRGQIERAAWSETQRQWRYVAGPIDYPEAHLEPASPPAPEVVDVPQPVVKRFGGVEASWGPGRLDVITLEEINGDDEPFDVPIALLRAMLAAIDAQQGGAS